ncbi:ABC transporter ATP-binding protein [Noviherbaspirillum malthae]|uniref:ABC transporter ATP-binding protein n=1 Tax=Noviherbaspirillum malthae TaxID=1260987 RepID=UPI001E443A83|nr:ABC transporter ATP-binding protein [Noviherbaspirillum malthae]
MLSIKDLDKRFGGLHAVRNVSLEVSPGEIVGILGPNGAGKTTLYNLITGFIPPDGGDIRFDGHSLRGLAPHKIVGLGMARTFQLCRPFVGMSVLENVLVGSLGPRVPAGDLEQRARNLLADVGLQDKEQVPAEQLSYGDQRRLEIARALATEPLLLLLDEPFAGLGSGEIAELSTLIRRLHADKGLTILLIEHKLREFMKLVSRVVAIDFGAVIASGTPEQIVAHPAVIEAYIGKQEEEHAA